MEIVTSVHDVAKLVHDAELLDVVAVGYLHLGRMDGRRHH